MNDFQNSTTSASYSFAPENESVPAPTLSAAVPVSDPPSVASSTEEPDWKEYLLSAKAAHQRGDEAQALQLYKQGLERANRALSRQQLIQFLRINLWG